MATLTYDPADGQPEFSEEELANIEVGEQMQQEQEAAYAGKFKDAAELEKAYLELQSKLGEGSANSTETEDAEPVEEQEELELSPAADLISEASSYYAENGTLTEELLAEFNEMSSKELVDAYMEMQGQLPTAEAADLSEAEVMQIKNQAGGEEGYGQLMEWAAENIDQSIVEAYDSLVDSGNAAAISLALRGIRAEFENSNGYEGRMLTGKAPVTSADTFRSQAEVVQAMQDPRYDKDPAYREDVFRKLDRSNVNF